MGNIEWTEDPGEIHRHDPWAQVGLLHQQSQLWANGLQNDLFSSEVISCLTQCSRERWVVAKGTDRTEVLPPETEVEQSGLDAPRMEARMEWPLVTADSRTLLCLNPGWHLLLDSHRNLKAQLEGNHCSWELQHRQQSTGKQMKMEWWAVVTVSLGCGRGWHPNKPAGQITDYESWCFYSGKCYNWPLKPFTTRQTCNV